MKLAELAVSHGPLSIFHNKYWEIERGPGDKASPGKTSLETRPLPPQRSVLSVGAVWLRD